MDDGWVRFSDKQICEADAREFIGDETYLSWLRDYEQLMAFRKTIKGKPTDEQRIQLQMNNEWIAFYDRVLKHSARMAKQYRCICAGCAKTRAKALR